jgi:hypothetical protein
VASPNVDLFQIGIDAYNGRDPEAFIALGWLIEVQDGKLRRGWAYASHHEVLVAAGIED